jgi:hypothetical protein
MKQMMSKYIGLIQIVLQQNWIKRFLKTLIVTSIFSACYIFVSDKQISLSKSDTILNTIITSLGIILAIVTTFIFSKVFSERTERIERKKIIDSYSKKVTALRRLAHKILLHNDIIWLNAQPRGIEELYPGLDLWSFRNAEYNKYMEIIKKTGGSELSIQAYLAAKMIEGRKPTEYMLDPTFHKNYSLEEIGMYREVSIYIYSFLSEYQSEIHLERLHSYWLTAIQEEVQIIDENHEKLEIKSLYLVFNEAYANYLVRLYELTQRNSKNVGTSFEGLLFDLALSSVIIIISVYALTFSICDHSKDMLMRISLCGLITVVVDILINTFISTKKELVVNEFYE